MIGRFRRRIRRYFSCISETRSGRNNDNVVHVREVPEQELREPPMLVRIERRLRRREKTSIIGILKINVDNIENIDVNTNVEDMLELKEMGVYTKDDVNISNDYGHTPLIFTTRNKNFNLTYLLLINGANVNIQNKIGYTPLMYACNNNDAIIVKLLLNFSDNYIDFSLINSGTIGDKTVWDYVINDSKCYKLLSEYSQGFIKIILENLKKKDIYADLGLIICKYLAYY